MKDEQEPIARVTGVHGGRFIVEPLNPAMVLPTDMALYSHPQPKTQAERAAWVGLTDEDVTSSHPYSVTRDKGCFHAGAKWAEAKLKEKNT